TQGCQAESQDVIVTPNTTPTATFAQTNVSCIGGADGTITLTPTNGIAPYQYSINGGTYQNSNVFKGLAFGTYSIVVRDAKMCLSAAISVSITEPTAVTASHLVTPFGCDTANTSQDAIVTITPGGGTPGYTYSFDGGVTFQVSASFSVGTAQTINYMVLDANGCSVNGVAIVDPYTPPTDMAITASPIYCSTPGTVATITVNTVTGGVLPYTYQIISPASAVTAPSATNNFINLAPNTYIIKVTDKNGCSITKAILVEEADKIAVTAALVNDVYCNGGNTGAVNFLVSNYITSGNYTFDLSPAAGAFTQTGDVISYTGLPAGSYSFTVTDRVSGCVATVTNFAVSEPALALNSTSSATNINCKTNNTIVTIAAAGGTAPYKYAIAKASDPVPSVTSFVGIDQFTVDTNNGVDMNWIVYVKDANGCDANNPQSILKDANPVITAAVATQCPSATGTYDITVTATGYSTVLLYSVDGVSYQSDNVITVNAPGNYNVIVKDANGCISGVTPVTILNPLILIPTVTSSPSCANGDGVVAVATTGGSGNYVYNIDGGAFGTAIPFVSVPAGNHVIGVRDTTTLCEVFVPIDLKLATPITGFVLVRTPVTCNGGSDGTITATMDTPAAGVNDNPEYLYSLNGGTPQSSNLFSGLAAGTYTVVVTSERNCKATQTIDVIQPNPIVVSAPVPVQYGCTTGNGNNYASITVSLPTGGSNVYPIYEFVRNGNPIPVQKGDNPIFTETDLLGGSYTINVYDSKGCLGTTTAIINPFVSIDFATSNAVTVTKAISCINDEEIKVNVTTLGTTVPMPTLSYNVKGIGPGSTYNVTDPIPTGQFTGLTVGNYLITVTNPITGCSITKIHYVNEPNTFDLIASNIKNVVCYGSSTGNVDLTLVDNQLVPFDDAGAFDYTITGPVNVSGTALSAGPITIQNLPVGVYTVKAKLTSKPNCDVETIFTIEQPTSLLEIFETHTRITCIPGNDGTISASANGGWPSNYEFELTGPVNVAYSTQSYFTGLVAGLYTVNVKDSNGCIATTTVTLSVPTPIIATASATASMLLCNGDTSGEIKVSPPTGGEGGNYSYILNFVSANPTFSSAPQTTPVFSGLAAGTYSVTVTDGLGCSSAPTTDILIAEPTKVEATLVLASGKTCQTDARLTISATGGTGPYDYSTDSNFATITGSFASSSSDTFSVGLGDHQYYVRDANGCVSFISGNVTINDLTPLSLDLDLSNAVINCNGDVTAVIDATATGGLANYTYTLLDNAKNPVRPIQTQGYFDMLPAGNYIVRVDSGDCQFEKGVIISQPAAPLAAIATALPVTCNGISNGQIVINASGGTGIIQSAISPNLNQFVTTGSFTGLKAGVYDILTQDERGCFISDQLTVSEPDAIVITVVPSSIKQELCVNDKTGAFSITIGGGIAPYSTSLDDLDGTYVPNQVDFVNLSGGEHTVYVKDMNSCITESYVTLNPAVVLNPVADANYDCVNNSPANSVTVTVDPSNTNLSLIQYYLDGSTTPQSSNVFTNLVPGDHIVYAEHANGCLQDSEKFTIDQIDPLAITIDLGELNEIVATVTGGSGVYQYTINGESMESNGKYIYFKSGNYTVTVTDSNGCDASATKYFEFIDIKIPPIFTPTGDGTNDTWKPTNTENYPDIKFVVYDRYGREVGTFGAGQSWDGKYNGTELPMGDYWYVLKLRHSKDDREFIGHFTLYR
ncbi:T9SS type B sorting domain-containing protein, partial [Flavobacterium taihuense]